IVYLRINRCSNSASPVTPPTSTVLCIVDLIRARIKAERVTPRQPAFFISCNLASIQSVSSSVNHTAVCRVFAACFLMPCAGVAACPVVLKTLSLVMLRRGLAMHNLLRDCLVCPRSFNLWGDIEDGRALSCGFRKPHALMDGVFENMTRLSYLLFRPLDHLAGMHGTGEPGRKNPQQLEGRVGFLFHGLNRGQQTSNP